MSETVDLIRRALSLPPHRAAWKTARWAGRRLTAAGRRSADRLRDPYAKPPAGSLGGLFADFDPATEATLGALLADEDWRGEAEQSVDLLGSGPVQPVYGGTPTGFEGRAYSAVKSGPRLTNLPWRARGTARTLRAALSDGYRPMDWFRDWRSGYRWPETGAGASRIAPVPGADIKWPWELGRLQHLPRLALAATLRDGASSDLAAAALRDQLLDFRAACPPGHGAPWGCTMDVAIRAANLAVAWSILRAASRTGEWAVADESLWSATLLEHARFIARNLEWTDDLRGNHYLCDLAGLAVVTAVLPATAETDALLAFAWRELSAESGRQFLPDGGNFEGSVCYHRLSLEALAWAVLAFASVSTDRVARLARCPETNFPRLITGSPAGVHLALEGLREILAAGAAFMSAVTGPDGRVPQIGDNDSGRFMAMRPREDDLDHRASLGFVRTIAENAEPGVGRALAPQALRASLGDGGPHGAFSGDEPPPLATFANFGLHVRRWPAGVQATFRCGPVGQRGFGGHDHADQLSITLSTAAGAVIVDPGTYVYTADPDARNRYRSAAAHALFLPVGQEPVRWAPGLTGLFRLAEAAPGRMIESGEALVEGACDGFGVDWRRRLRFEMDGIAVEDRLALTGPKCLTVPLAPEVDVVLDGACATVRRGRWTIALSLPEPLRWTCEQGHVSPAYGKTRPAPVLRARVDAEHLAWRIDWRREAAGTEEPDVSPAGAATEAGS